MTEPQENLHFLDYWRVIRSRKEVVIAVFLLVVITGILVTLAMPKVYMGSTVIAVKEEAPDVHLFSPEMNRYDPLFLRTQFEVIQSGPVIEEVARRLGLNTKLGAAYGYGELPPDKVAEKTRRVLARGMKVQQYRDTNLIEIQILMSEPKETAPQDVADTANMVAEVYRSQSMQRSHEETERALTALFEQVQEQEVRVNEAEQRVEDIRQQYKIDEVPFGGVGGSLDTMSLTALEAQRIQVRVALEDAKAKYEKIASLPPAEVLDAAPFVAREPAVAQLVASKRMAEVQLQEFLEASLGRNHPDVVRTKGRIKELEVKIGEALSGLKAGMRIAYEAAQAKYDALEAMLEDKKSVERAAEGTGYREFEKAKEELEHARNIRNALEIRYLQEKIELRIPRTMVQIIEPAKPPEIEDAVSPDFTLNVILSILIGLASGVGLAYFIEYLDTSLKTVEEIEQYMRVPVLGVIPQKVKPFVDRAADTAHAEAYRVLRANVQFSNKRGDGKVMCVTSGSVGEGKSLTVFNFAYVCAQLGDKALIVDGDLHRPRQHKILGVSRNPGLANVLVGEAELDETVIHTDIENLDLLTSGRLSSGVHGLLDTRKMKDLVDRVKDRYDVVLFDAPPMIGVSDTSLLVREMDAVLLVIQHRKYPRTVSKRAKDMIENVGANIVGVVLNNINISRDYSYYYYHYYSYPKPEGAAQT